jgi:hypothetical protein
MPVFRDQPNTYCIKIKIKIKIKRGLYASFLFESTFGKSTFGKG